MTCPFCRREDGKLLKKEPCMFPAFYRGLHEQYNVNITRTLERVFGDDKPVGICAIILVR